MFENLVNNIKAKTSKVSNFLTFENFKSNTSKLSENFDNLKYKFVSNSTKVSTYLSGSDYEAHQDYLSPRAYADEKTCAKTDLKWPVVIDNRREYIPYIPPPDEIDIVERFIKVVTLNEEDRRTDREEIRRRLAMGSESEDYYAPGDRPGRKPSLQARLQSGMNLQICFMNETVSDSDSPNSDSESTTLGSQAIATSKPTLCAPPFHKSPKLRPRLSQNILKQNGQRPLSLPINQTKPAFQPLSEPITEADFFARQARLQIEARMALAQAKEMAHMQMEVERQRQKKSPITEMVRSSLEKVGIQFPEERRRVSRQILTEMNVAQLQVIVNDLHTQIEGLNEGLVRFLMDRDDLHMEQDSMLVDIEDLTRYLGAKEQTVKEQKLVIPPSNTHRPSSPTPLMVLSSSVKPRLHRIASLVKK